MNKKLVVLVMGVFISTSMFAMESPPIASMKSPPIDRHYLFQMLNNTGNRLTVIFTPFYDTGRFARMRPSVVTVMPAQGYVLVVEKDKKISNLVEPVRLTESYYETSKPFTNIAITVMAHEIGPGEIGPGGRSIYTVVIPAPRKTQRGQRYRLVINADRTVELTPYAPLV